MDIRKLNGKKIVIKENECPKFKEKIKKAKEEIDLAICGLSYDSMPDLNEEILNELKNISLKLEEINNKKLFIPFNIK